MAPRMGPLAVADAAEDDRGQQEGGVGRYGAGELVRGRVDAVADVGADRAGEAGEGGAEGEGDELDAEAVDAHGGCSSIVLADGDPGAADTGVGGAVEDRHKTMPVMISISRK